MQPAKPAVCSIPWLDMWTLAPLEMGCAPESGSALDVWPLLRSSIFSWNESVERAQGNSFKRLVARHMVVIRHQDLDCAATALCELSEQGIDRTQALIVEALMPKVAAKSVDHKQPW